MAIFIPFLWQLTCSVMWVRTGVKQYNIEFQKHGINCMRLQKLKKMEFMECLYLWDK